jgi:DNA repair exonuclease SbcCD nuclease subunit
LKEAIMVGRPFRFVHASDLHLESVAQGISEVPDHLRDLLVDGPYRATERLVETALAEDVDFIILSGDVLNPMVTGPRGPLFLGSQFQRLAERKIPIYWAGGSIDPPDAWPSWLRLPETVHVFPAGHVEEIVHQRDGVSLARLVGLSRIQDRPVDLAGFEADPSGLFTIGAFHGEVEAASLSPRGLHYWALGGLHATNTLCNTPCVAHYSGSPQGRSRQETGAHGCTLVQVDEQRHIRTNLLPTDMFRWCEEYLVVDEHTTREGLESLLRERVQTLSDASSEVVLLISWTVAGTGPLMGRLRSGPLAAELLARLRADFGQATPARWSLSITCEPAARLPDDWYEQETFLGDYLRALRHFQVNADEAVGLEDYLDERQQAGSLGAMAHFADPAVREQILREAAQLGADLLRGEEIQP